MTTKVLERDAFINGHICYAGETVEMDGDTQNFAPAPSTPLMALDDDQLRAELDRRALKAGNAPFIEPKAQPNFDTDPRTGLGKTTVAPPLTDPVVLPRSNMTRDEILDALEDRGDKVDADAPDADLVKQLATPPAAGDTLTKSEIVDALKARGDTVDASKTKAELQAQLATPPSA